MQCSITRLGLADDSREIGRSIRALLYNNSLRSFQTRAESHIFRMSSYKSLSHKWTNERTNQLTNWLNQTNLEVVFPVNGNSWAEYVTHDDKVWVWVTDSNAVHSQVLRKTSVRILFYDVLQNNNNFQLCESQSIHKWRITQTGRWAVNLTSIALWVRKINDASQIFTTAHPQCSFSVNFLKTNLTKAVHLKHSFHIYNCPYFAIQFQL